MCMSSIDETNTVQQRIQIDDFQLLSADDQLTELKLMMEHLTVTSKVCFDHVGNYWQNGHGELLFSQSYEGYKFPEEKTRVLELIDEGLAAGNKRPAFLRL